MTQLTIVILVIADGQKFIEEFIHATINCHTIGVISGWSPVVVTYVTYRLQLYSTPIAPLPGV